MISALLRQRPPPSILSLPRPQLCLSSTSTSTNSSTSTSPSNSSQPELSSSPSSTTSSRSSSSTSKPPESASTGPRIRRNASTSSPPSQWIEGNSCYHLDTKAEDTPLRRVFTKETRKDITKVDPLKRALKKLQYAQRVSLQRTARATTPDKPPTSSRSFSTFDARPYAPSITKTKPNSSVEASSAGHEGDNLSGGLGSTQREKRKKTLVELDEELKVKLESLSGGGGEAGLELEGGVPVAMKRGVRENMFRLI